MQEEPSNPVTLRGAPDAERGRRRYETALGGHSDWLAAAAIALGSIGFATGTAVLTRAFTLARLDDWAYRKIALDFSRTHHLHLVGWNDVNLLGQIIIVQPFLWVFGPSNATLSGFGVFAAFVAVLLSYAVAREVLPQRRALLVILALVAFPSFALLSTSFMTDATAFAAEMACVLLGIKGLRSRHQTPFLVTAVAVGFFGFTVREFALAAPVGLLAACALQRRPSERTVLAVSLVLTAAAATFYIWRESLQPPVHPVALVPAGGVVPQLGQTFFTLALGCLPITVMVAQARRPGGVALATALLFAATAVIAGIALIQQSHLLLGATVTRTGANWEGMLVGRQALTFSPAAWALIVMLALVSGCILAYETKAFGVVWTRTWWRSGPCQVLVLVGCAQIVLLVVRALTGGGITDRYLWPVIVVMLTLLLHALPGPPPLLSRFLAGSALVALMLISAATLVDSYGFAATRWHLGQAAGDHGERLENVDAGFEWVGTYYPGVANQAGVPRSTEPRTAYLVRLFSRMTNCYLVSSTVLNITDLVLVSSADYEAFGLFGRRRLLLYKNGLLGKRGACVARAG